MSPNELTKKTKILKWINIFGNALVFSIAFIALILQIFYPIDTKSIIAGLALAIVILTFILILLNKLYQKHVEKDVLSGNSFNDIINEFRTDDKFSSIQSARNELRDGLSIFLYTGIGIFIYWTIVSQNIYIFATGICLFLIAYIYADYLPHARHYSKLYDYICDNKSKNPNPTRGLARIYLDEFLRKDNNKEEKTFYKKPPEDFNNYIPLSKKDANITVQDTVIKNILFMRANSIQSPIIVISIILLFLNILFAIPSVANGIIDNFLNDLLLYLPTLEKPIKYTPLISNISIAIINFILMIANLSNVFSYKDKCTTLYELKEAYNSKDPQERIDSYNKLKDNEKRKFELLKARGVFTFCSTYIDEGKTLDGIGLKYRMLFCHRLHANRSRFRITFALGLIALIFTLFNWNINLLLSSIIIICSIIAALLFYKFWLPNLGKRRIINQCEKLYQKKE